MYREVGNRQKGRHRGTNCRRWGGERTLLSVTRVIPLSPSLCCAHICCCCWCVPRHPLRNSQFGRAMQRSRYGTCVYGCPWMRVWERGRVLGGSSWRRDHHPRHATPSALRCFLFFPFFLSACFPLYMHGSGSLGQRGGKEERTARAALSSRPAPSTCVRRSSAGDARRPPLIVSQYSAAVPRRPPLFSLPAQTRTHAAPPPICIRPKCM